MTSTFKPGVLAALAAPATSSGVFRSPFARAAPAPVPAHPLLDRLWSRYVVDVPYAARFARLHHSGGDGRVHNDHIALRTLASPGPGIASFARVFERLGWRLGGEYQFPDVHLRAIYLRKDGFPRIFISELQAEHLPADARRALVDASVLKDPAPDDDNALAAWFREPSSVSGAKIDVVAPASQYGAWLLAFGRKVNHFTAAVGDVELWQLKLLQHGVPMKPDIEGAPGGNLRQTATHASVLPVYLDDGAVRTMPYAYFEIAERKNGFDGFLAPQARQLFDMTKPADEATAKPSSPVAAERAKPIAVVEDVAEPYRTERRHPRKDAIIPVDVAWGSGQARLQVRTQNLSIGGAFLTFDDGHTPPLQAHVELTFEIPKKGRVTASGTVVWRMEKSAGVELTWWDDDDTSRQTLAAFLDTLV